MKNQMDKAMKLRLSVREYVQFKKTFQKVCLNVGKLLGNPPPPMIYSRGNVDIMKILLDKMK